MQKFDHLPKTKKDARKSNSHYYFTVIACQNNHLCPRYTEDGRCVQCTREKTSRYRNKNLIKTRELSNNCAKTKQAKEYRSKYEKNRRWSLKLDIIKNYGGKCECCGE